MTQDIESAVSLKEVVLSIFDDFVHNNIDKVGQIVEGTVVSYDKKKGIVIVDVGLKTAGVIPVKEFDLSEGKDNIEVGSKVKVYISSIDSKEGKFTLSKEMATREDSWLSIKEAFENGTSVTGIPFAKVKGGLSVDFKGLIAFLPGSQIDDGPVRDISHLVGKPIAFKVISLDPVLKSAIVSRKSIIDDSYRSEREKFFTEVKEGDIVEGTIRNITDYGAFVDLGFGLDALLHLADITWDRVSHPSEVLKIGDKIKAKVIKNDRDTGKIALSMKHTVENSWVQYVKDLSVGQTVSGEITNIVDYGVFIQISEKIEGLIHISEITWSKDYYKKHKEYKVGETIEATIIEIDTDKQRVALSVKRLLKNPWKEFAESHNINDIVESTIARVTEYGLLVTLGEIEGLVHVDDISWSGSYEEILSNYKAGDSVKVIYLGTDDKFTKIKLGIKQLVPNPFEQHADLFKVGNNVTCTVIKVRPDRLDVKIVEGVFSNIKKMSLSREKTEQRVERFVLGDKIDAKIIAFDEKTKKITLSVKDLEEEEYRDVLKKYGSNDTGASIADILGMAFDDFKKK